MCGFPVFRRSHWREVFDRLGKGRDDPISQRRADPMLQLRKIHIGVPNRDDDLDVWEVSANSLAQVACGRDSPGRQCRNANNRDALLFNQFQALGGQSRGWDVLSRNSAIEHKTRDLVFFIRCRQAENGRWLLIMRPSGRRTGVLLVPFPFRQLLDQFTGGLEYETLPLRIKDTAMAIYFRQDQRRDHYFFVKVSDRFLLGELFGQLKGFIIVHCKKPLVEPGFQRQNRFIAKEHA